MNIELVVEESPEIAGQLAYVESEYSFYFRASPGQVPGYGAAVVTVGTLQISIDVESGRAVYVSGLRPRLRWRGVDLPEPVLSPGAVRFVLRDGDFAAGVGLSYPGSDDWPTWYDVDTGWVCVGDREARMGTLVAAQTGLAVRRGELAAIWLKPDFVA